MTKPDPPPLQDVLASVIARAKEQAARPKPVRRGNVMRDPVLANAAYEEIEKPVKGSEDALDRKAFRKGGFSKAEKRAYAQQKFVEELVQPPKNPPPAWLADPSLLPKKPPGRTEE